MARCRFFADPELSTVLDEMAFEFGESYHEVILLPSKIETCANDGGCIRVATNRNPKWYREMCARFPKKRGRARKKPRTHIKKEEVLVTIQRLAGRGVSTSKYCPYILDEARRRFENNNIIPFDNQF